jgi:CheY-like chemotaxis protein
MAKVLIVDDEVGIRDWLSEILEDEGYRVATAANGSEGRQKLADSLLKRYCSISGCPIVTGLPC